VERGSTGTRAGGLRALDLKIDDDGILAAPHHDSLAWFVGKCVDLLVRYIRRHIDEIARAGLAAEFQAISPSHARTAANDVEDGFQFAVVMRAGLRVRLNYDRACPELVRSGSGVGDGGGTSHAGCLGRICVQVARRHDFDAVVLPVHDLHDSRFFFGELSQRSQRHGVPLPFQDWSLALGDRGTGQLAGVGAAALLRARYGLCGSWEYTSRRTIPTADPPRIDYSRILTPAPAPDYPAMCAYLTEELPYVWLDEYITILPHQHNVHRVPVEAFEYLWDMSSELVQQGIVAASSAVDDRLIAAHGLSRPATEGRRDSRLRGRTLGPVSVVDSSERLPYDRGHAIGHALGGVLDLNIIPQTRAVNRGGLWRQMERYCQEHSGTYFFCRPIYAGLSSHPKEIEFGVLRSDASLWAHTFKNYGTVEEFETFERLYREKIAKLT
jgi:DNA/RNA non-specific endonuclease